MKIAIVGGGVSGLVCAWLLNPQHEITVYEANGYIGGHTNTVPVSMGGRTWSVDTGFIVFNHLNYPNFTKILDRLGVESQPSTMSFSVRCDATGLEWGGHTIRTLFAQKKNLMSPRFLGMVRDILRFNKLAKALVESGSDDETLGEFLDRHRLGEWFRTYYIVPMSSAIWSMPPSEIMAFPARYMAQFMYNHRMLQVEGRPEWRTVSGGSWSYVRAMTETFRDRIRTSAPVQSIRRDADGVTISSNGSDERYDHVIIAAHADQALRMLHDATDTEQAVLGAMPYQKNEATLHTDVSLMPQRRLTWSAWNTHVDPRNPNQPACLTYNQNILQRLHAPKQFLVTLGDAPIAEDQVIRRITYHHPLFTRESVRAQGRHAEISGVERTHFCGAYWGFGFHEDGVVSGLRVCKHFGVEL